MKKQTIPIFFASDNNYVPFLATAMKSLIVNASPKYNYEINVLQTGISEKNQQKMRNMAEDNFKIRFIDIEPLLTDIKERLKLRLRDYYSISIYYRLFIESLFKQKFEPKSFNSTFSLSNMYTSCGLHKIKFFAISTPKPRIPNIKIDKRLILLTISFLNSFKFITRTPELK